MCPSSYIRRVIWWWTVNTWDSFEGEASCWNLCNYFQSNPVIWAWRYRRLAQSLSTGANGLRRVTIWIRVYLNRRPMIFESLISGTSFLVCIPLIRSSVKPVCLRRLFMKPDALIYSRRYLCSQQSRRPIRMYNRTSLWENTMTDNYTG